MNKLVMRFISELVEPTAAREASPAKRPTTITSAALNKSCKTPDNIIGMVKIINLPKSGPWVISIFLLEFID